MVNLRKVICLSLVIPVTLLFSGCASYSPGVSPLSDINASVHTKQDSGVTVGVRELGPKEIRATFKRNIHKHFVAPVYIVINNKSQDTYQFRKNSVNKSLFSANETADKGKFSVFWRVLPFSPFIVSVFLWPFLIPALVGGLGAVNANKLMRADYVKKEIDERDILPEETLSGFLYFDSRVKGESFVIRLKNLSSEQMAVFEFAR
ncbi:MAG: hypothetical protein WC695_10645 [Candidatus Omnitrophota bacterium]